MTEESKPGPSKVRPQGIASSTELDWEAATKAAEWILKQCRDIGFTPPEAIDIHQMRIGNICDGMNTIVRALKIQPPGAHRDDEGDRRDYDAHVMDERDLREKATRIAKRAAARNPPSYYTGADFEPHAWVVDAIAEALEAPRSFKFDRAELEGRLRTTMMVHLGTSNPIVMRKVLEDLVLIFDVFYGELNASAPATSMAQLYEVGEELLDRIHEIGRELQAGGWADQKQHVRNRIAMLFAMVRNRTTGALDDPSAVLANAAQDPRFGSPMIVKDPFVEVPPPVTAIPPRETREQRFDRLIEKDTHYGQLHSAWKAFAELEPVQDVSDGMIRRDWDAFRTGWNESFKRREQTAPGAESAVYQLIHAIDIVHGSDVAQRWQKVANEMRDMQIGPIATLRDLRAMIARDGANSKPPPAINLPNQEMIESMPAEVRAAWLAALNEWGLRGGWANAMTAIPREIVPGDVVRLRSGGDPMTVESITPARPPSTRDTEEALCAWWAPDDPGLRRGHVPLAALEKVSQKVAPVSASYGSTGTYSTAEVEAARRHPITLPYALGRIVGDEKRVENRRVGRELRHARSLSAIAPLLTLSERMALVAFRRLKLGLRETLTEYERDVFDLANEIIDHWNIDDHRFRRLDDIMLAAADEPATPPGADWRGVQPRTLTETLPHAFVPSRGINFTGPPLETCDLCGTDPRNLTHLAIGDACKDDSALSGQESRARWLARRVRPDLVGLIADVRVKRDDTYAPGARVWGPAIVVSFGERTRNVTLSNTDYEANIDYLRDAILGVLAVDPTDVRP